MKTRVILTVALIFAMAEAASAKMISDRERARQQAEHLCYDDVQRLCSVDIPNEAKIEACMNRHRSQLSPGCRRVFDTGLK